MEDEMIDRKPTLKFNYKGFTMAEQNKVEDTKSATKQKKLYNCIFMAKHPNKFIRLPSHLACKTCPRAQVDCCIELSDDYPDGNLEQRCATCLSNNCGFVKKDKDTRAARAELRTWLDQELGRSREELAKRRAAEKARNESNGIFAVDAPPPVIAPDRGARTKRHRPNYVDSESEDEDRPVRSRARASAAVATESFQESAETSQAAKNSAFVQQAIKLVTSSQTIEKQLGDMQKIIDTAVAAKVMAEGKITEIKNGQAESDGQKDRYEEEIKSLKVEVRAAQTERDKAVIKVAHLEHSLERREGMVEQRLQAASSAHQKALEEKEKEVAGIKKVAEATEEKVAGLEAEFAKEKKDLVMEKAEHAKTKSQLVKWQATFAALSGPS